MPSHKYTVEKLDFDDVVWYAEVASVNMLVNEMKRPDYVHLPTIYSIIYKMIEQGTAWIAKIDGKPVGALGGLLATNPFNPSIITLVEVFWYVHDDYRNTRVGAMLFKSFDEAASTMAHESTMCLLSTSKVNHETLEKKGYVSSEMCFRKIHKET